MTRREFCLAVVFCAESLLMACDKPKPAQPNLRPAAVDWSQLPAFERIRRLELLQNPSTPGLNSTTELIAATAEFYCQEIPTIKTSQELQRGVFVLSPERYLEELRRDKSADSNETEEETLSFAQTSLEFVSRRDRTVYINDRRVIGLVQANSSIPEYRRMLAGRDMKTIILKSVLFHAYSHASATEEVVNIEPIVLDIFQGRPVVDKIAGGFNFTGSYPDGRPYVYSGASEPLTEYTARLVAQKTGSAMSLPLYIHGAELVEMTNQRVGLQPDIFKAIYTGRRSTEELLTSWGSLRNQANPDKQAATRALLTIGISTTHPEIISAQGAADSVGRLLGF